MHNSKLSNELSTLVSDCVKCKQMEDNTYMLYLLACIGSATRCEVCYQSEEKFDRCWSQLKATHMSSHPEEL